MYLVMSSPLSKRPQAATRQLPIATGREDGKDPKSQGHISVAPRSTSETRLQTAVVRRDSSTDPYADVAGTD
jgi:hypothetical protein